MNGKLVILLAALAAVHASPLNLFKSLSENSKGIMEGLNPGKILETTGSGLGIEEQFKAGIDAAKGMAEPIVSQVQGATGSLGSLGDNLSLGSLGDNLSLPSGFDTGAISDIVKTGMGRMDGAFESLKTGDVTNIIKSWANIPIEDVETVAAKMGLQEPVKVGTDMARKVVDTVAGNAGCVQKISRNMPVVGSLFDMKTKAFGGLMGSLKDRMSGLTNGLNGGQIKEALEGNLDIKSLQNGFQSITEDVMKRLESMNLDSEQLTQVQDKINAMVDKVKSTVDVQEITKFTDKMKELQTSITA